MNKFIQDGKVAVIFSPDHGWWTNHFDDALVFDPAMVQQILDGFGPAHLQVTWVNTDDKFRPELFRGKEVILVKVPGTYEITGKSLDQDKKWLTA